MLYIDLSSSTYTYYYKKGDLSCVFFLGNLGVLNSGESIGILANLGFLLKINLFAWDIKMPWILFERLDKKYPPEIRYSGKVYLFSWNIEVFLCGIYLPHRKLMAFFFILN